MHVATQVLIISILVLIIGAVIHLIGEEQGRAYYIGAAIFWPAAVATFVTAIVAACAFGGSISCEHKADDMNRDWRFGLAAGCRVQSDDGRFVPIDNLRITNEEVDE